MNIKDFKINVSQSEIDALNLKIDSTRWPDEVNDKHWTMGTSKEFLKSALDYWKNDFSWSKHESKINEVGSYIFKSNTGLDIHFLHSKSKDSNAIPIIMTHGWPGSVQEFLKIIPVLNKGINGICFDVICPSMPGYGFSSKPKKNGINSKEIAKINHELMHELGYKKYVAQGGDWGATVSKWTADLFKEHCIGLHLNMILAFPPEGDDPYEGVSEEEKEGMQNFQKYQEKGSGYFAIQSTKPQTVAYGLTDSPAGLAGWIIEKFHAWTNDNENKLVIPLEEVLAIISLYWYSNSIASSMRLYYENGQAGFSFDYVEQPTGCALFDKEIVLPPRVWVEKIYNVKQWDKFSGGHFAALENPKNLAASIVNFCESAQIKDLIK